MGSLAGSPLAHAGDRPVFGMGYGSPWGTTQAKGQDYNIAGMTVGLSCGGPTQVEDSPGRWLTCARMTMA